MLGRVGGYTALCKQRLDENMGELTQTSAALTRHFNVNTTRDTWWCTGTDTVHMKRKLLCTWCT